MVLPGTKPNIVSSSEASSSPLPASAAPKSRTKFSKSTPRFPQYGRDMGYLRASQSLSEEAVIMKMSSEVSSSLAGTL